MRYLSPLLFLVPAGFAISIGCSSNPVNCADSSSCSSDDAGLASDGQADVDAPPGCDLTKDPQDSRACIDDSVGVFVSPNGDDGATGGKAAPVKTIDKALDLAASKSLPRVYVCEGSYGDAAEIKAPISLYGGLSCAWAYTGNKPKLAPAKGIALKITVVSGVVLVQDMEVDGAADSATPGDSAIAVFVSQSAAVTFTNAALTAGDGVTGGTGKTPANFTAAKATIGGTSSGTTGGKGAACVCTDAHKSTGGDGASGSGANVIPGDGTSDPAVGTSNSGNTKMTTCDVGLVGADGLTSTEPTAAQTSSGSLTADGWVQPNAAAAPNGRPAQGGGGGGAKTDPALMSPGGGGACGGCGGAGGSSGQSGGSSFALLSLQSTVSVTGTSTLTAGAGAKGGKGGAGQVGQAGGDVGPGAACNGGAGGNGSGGNGGSGGAGGHSAAVGYSGTAPTTAGATLMVGALGSGGDAGDVGLATGTGNPGAGGVKGGNGQSIATLLLGQ